MRYIFEEEFRLDHPETVGETDSHFDLDNYKDWLEAQLIEARKQLASCNVSGSVLEQIRQAFADYRRSEGCSCCRDMDAHEEAEKRLAELLKPEPYEDGSGWDWGEYGSINILGSMRSSRRNDLSE